MSNPDRYKYTDDDFKLPGYARASLSFNPIVSGKTKKYFRFAIDPQSIQEQRANNFQIDKTMGGWFLSRTGQQLGQITVTGLLMDTKVSQERIKFLQVFDGYAVDSRNKYLEYSSDYYQVLEIEGIAYTGIIQNISLSKTSQMPFVYQININFMFTKTQIVHQPSTEASGSGSTSSVQDPPLRPASTLARLLSTDDEEYHLTSKTLPINDYSQETVSKISRRKRNSAPSAVSNTVLNILLRKEGE